MRNAYIVGAYEHPTRKAPDKSIAQLHAEVAIGALADAGLTMSDIDGLITSGDSPGMGPLSMAEYLGVKPRYVDTIDTGGSSYVIAVGQAQQAIAQDRCDAVLITLAGKPRSGNFVATDMAHLSDLESPEVPYELPYDLNIVSGYALSAKRHMYEFGTTSEQLAWVKVAASHHAQHNENAMLRQVVTVDDVVSSPMISDPLHRLDCCVVTDGGGAIIVAREEIARKLSRPLVAVRGTGVGLKDLNGGRMDLTSSAAVQSGRMAFDDAKLTPADVQYASIYDSFTITVVVQLEDLGFCEKGKGGAFVADGQLISGVGSLPVNTDGGGLSNNHPGNRGGMTKIIEAVRQLRGEAHPAVQVKDCSIALAHATGGLLSTRHASATALLERR